jgi:hypothetical protein
MTPLSVKLCWPEVWGIILPTFFITLDVQAITKWRIILSTHRSSKFIYLSPFTLAPSFPPLSIPSSHPSLHSMFPLHLSLSRLFLI